MARHTRMTTLLVSALVAGLGAAACGGDAPPLIHGEAAPGIDEVAINSAVLGFMGEKGVEGATVAVTRAGRLVWSKAYGLANKDGQIPMQPWHRSRIGSVSKMITATALLRMLEADAPAPGSLATGPSSLASKLAVKVYGNPGTNWSSPYWPNVTEPTALANPEQYWEAIRDGVQNFYPDTFATDMARMIEWGSTMELGHLLSHSSGLPRSGSAAAAAAAFGLDESEVTYPQIHKTVLMALLGEQAATGSQFKCYLGGFLYVEPAKDEAETEEEAEVDEQVPTYPLPGLIYKPGTDSCYSNHGFGLVGHIIDEQAGPDTSYPQLVKQTILEPLGLPNVVLNNTEISELDAWPHGSALDETDPATSGATGGWSASARDLVRIMCGLDGVSNHLRLLQPQAVATMITDAYPEANSSPLGWDTRYDLAVTKNGSIGGGRSQITKYLPGRFDAAPEDEINVAVNVNSSAASPSIALLRTIAATVAAADIPADYDLFDPAYACVVPPEEPGLVAPQPTLTAVPEPPPLVVPTAPAPPAPPAPPTVAIRQPTSGQKIAQNGVASILFSGFARDADGEVIPGTYYRWTAAKAGTTTVLCTGSDFDTGTTPATIGGLTTVVDCGSFTRTLHNPVPGAGPPITIRLEAQDQAGTSASATVVISLVTPPVG
jgi:CubicO group peptidase (beta-lactamase class C family)